MSLLSERGLGQAVLLGTSTNVDGDQTLRNGLPAGFGDCLITELLITVLQIATHEVAFATSGPVAYIEISSGIVDFLGTEHWVMSDSGATAQVAAHIRPDEPVFWREGEELRVDFAEIDINATPTADVFIRVRVQRLRQPRVQADEFMLVRPYEGPRSPQRGAG